MFLKTMHHLRHRGHFGLAALAVLLIDCSPTKTKEYQELLAERTALEQEKSALERKLMASDSTIQKLQAELAHWKADDIANFKHLVEELDISKSVDQLQALRSEVERFPVKFPKSELVAEAQTLLVHATERLDSAVAEAQRREAARLEDERSRAQREDEARAERLRRALANIKIDSLGIGDDCAGRGLPRYSYKIYGGTYAENEEAATLLGCVRERPQNEGDTYYCCNQFGTWIERY